MNTRIAVLLVPLLGACSVGGLPTKADDPLASALPAPPALAPAAEEDALPATPALLAGGGSGGSTKLKLGAFFPGGDLHELDTGIYGEVAFSRDIIPILAIEGTVGYLSTDGTDTGIDADIWAIPLFVNGRVQLPILIFEAYGGVGVGGMYVDYEVGPLDESDFVAAWDAFLGLELGLESIGVGAEVKYLQTEDTKNDFAVQGTSATLYLSLGF